VNSDGTVAASSMGEREARASLAGLRVFFFEGAFPRISFLARAILKEVFGWRIPLNPQPREILQEALQRRALWVHKRSDDQFRADDSV